MTAPIRCLLLTLTAGFMFPAATVAAPKLPAVGQPAPNFKLRAMDGAVYRLTDFAFTKKAWGRKTKQPVLLDFFRTDCDPCLKSMPELVELHNTYASRGLKVIVVALLEEEDGRKKLETYLAGKNFPFLLVVDPTDFVAQRYLGKTVSLPATFLIDKNGTLLQTKHDAKGSLLKYFKDTLTKVTTAPVEKSTP